MQTYKQKNNKNTYSNHWSTPKEIYDHYVIKGNYFDPCPLHGIDFDFKYVNKDVYINPPYSRDQIEKWIDWAIEQKKTYHKNVVLLLPARTDTKWFWKMFDHGCDVEFIKGRLKFGNATSGAPFPSVLVHLL